jgi:hypothetical protein
MSINFYRDECGDIVIAMVDKFRKSAIIILDENILVTNRKFVLKNEFLPVNNNFFNEEYFIENSISSTKIFSRPTLYNLYGEGMEGKIIKNENCQSIKIKNPLIISSYLHEEFFLTLARKTLIYMEMGIGLESIFNGWNVLYNFDKTPKFTEKGKQQMESKISYKDIFLIKELNMHLNSSPINLFLLKIGYESIINLPRGTGIKLNHPCGN